MTKKAGRISEYEKAGGDDKAPDMVRGLALRGAIEEEIAKAFGVSRRSITTWKQEHPKFLEALNEGRAVADSKVELSLFERATGYKHPEDKIFMHEGEPVVVPTVKHYPPDTAAMIFFLKNRKPKEWRDKQEIEHNHNLSDMTDEQLKARFKELHDKANAGDKGTA